jgi:DNA N-6-adenine-methyltransferase Dam
MVLRKLSSTSARAFGSRIFRRRRFTRHFGSHHQRQRRRLHGLKRWDGWCPPGRLRVIPVNSHEVPLSSKLTNRALAMVSRAKTSVPSKVFLRSSGRPPNCDPPYGRQIGLWLAKAREAALAGATVVALIPARTDTKWWHGIVTAASEIRYLPGRLRSAGSKHSAPFPSAVAIWRRPSRCLRRQNLLLIVARPPRSIARKA